MSPNFLPIKILKIVKDEITLPKMNGAVGSALYSIPFELNRNPDQHWINLFVSTWNRPPQRTNRHRPGIASVIGNRLILDGTTIEEVASTHRQTLLLCILEANEKYEYFISQRKQESTEMSKDQDQLRKSISDAADKIKFD